MVECLINKHDTAKKLVAGKNNIERLYYVC